MSDDRALSRAPKSEDANRYTRYTSEDFADMSALEFVVRVLKEAPYAKQEEMLRAVDGARRVSVVGCNGSGKDWTAARIVLWWVHRHSPAKAIVTGPTLRQVDDIVWNEIRYAHARLPKGVRGRMFRTARYKVDEQTFALGFTSNSPFNLQGFHSPNLLVAVTEAHAVSRDDMDALRRLNPSCFLMTGNPFVMSGEFFDSHHSRRSHYETVQISAMETPNIKEGRIVIPGMMTVQDVEDRKQDWGEDSPMYTGSVLGRFPDNLDGVVVPLRYATEAAHRRLEPDADDIVTLACDVARFGRDRTVIMRRQGAVVHIVRRIRGDDTMQIVGALKSYCDEHRVDVLVVDETGVGGGVVDRLRELPLGDTRIVPFNAGAKAKDDKRYANRSAEVWWAMRERYMSGDICTDNDDALISQVSAREYDYDSSGRMRLKSKRSMASSPDEADALAMTFAAEGRIGLNIWV